MLDKIDLFSFNKCMDPWYLYVYFIGDKIYTCVDDEGIELKEKSSTRTSLTTNFILTVFADPYMIEFLYPFIWNHQQGWWRKMMNQHFSSILDSSYLHSYTHYNSSKKRREKEKSNKEMKERKQQFIIDAFHVTT